MSESRPPYDFAPPASKLHFQDITVSVVNAWNRAGYAWQDLVDGFGGGDGAGMPSEGMFRELAQDMVEARLKGQPEAELRRLMRSRLYRRHYDIDRHLDFMDGSDEDTDRAELLGRAVWNCLFDRMKRQYVEPDSLEEDDESEDDDVPEPDQLALPLYSP